MNTIKKEFWNKFDVDKLKIYENSNWVWSLRPQQITLGSSILVFKKDANELSDLTIEEFTDLLDVIKIIENTLKDVLGFSIVNYLMLMLVDKQLHYHVIPRYSKKVIFNNETYVDEDWPKPPRMDNKIEVLDQELMQLLGTLKKSTEE